MEKLKTGENNMYFLKAKRRSSYIEFKFDDFRQYQLKYYELIDEGFTILKVSP